MSYSALVQQQSAGHTGSLPFVSRRSPVYGMRGCVACSQPLAAEAGLRILQRGGNAADAAVGVAAALGVTEPCSTGAGGDAFALFFSAEHGTVSCLQGNGEAPARLSLDAVRAVGVAGSELPPRSALCVTVPGAVALWEDALAKWGRLGLADVLAPAIELAEGGFPVSPLTAREWQAGAPAIRGPGARALVDAAGRGPAAGQLWRNPDLAATYRRIAQHGAREGFYTGPVAEAIVSALQAAGGVLSLADLEQHRSREVAPLSTTYRGHLVWEVPPPTAGIVALMALNILEAGREAGSTSSTSSTSSGSQAASGSSGQPGQAGAQQPGQAGAQPWSVPQLHAAIEALRLAFADGLAWVADSEHHEQPVSEMVCTERAQQRHRDFFRPDKACRPEPCVTLQPGPHKAVKGGDTCQWVVVDGDGNAASFIQSNYMGFGTGIVPAGCGFSLQNRGHGFLLQPGRPNSLAPGKRPYHTILPALLTKPAAPGSGAPGGEQAQELVAAFGCMGGYMQPQGHVQARAARAPGAWLAGPACTPGARLHVLAPTRSALAALRGAPRSPVGPTPCVREPALLLRPAWQLLHNLLALGLDPQAALDAPRFCIDRLDSAVGPASCLDSHVLLEQGFNQQQADGLAAKGHRVEAERCCWSASQLHGHRHGC